MALEAIERIQVQVIDQVRDEIADEILEDYLSDIYNKIEYLKKKKVIDEYGFINVDEFSFMFYDGTKKGRNRLLKLFKRYLNMLRKNVSFKKVFNRFKKALTKKLMLDEYAFIVFIRDLDRYYRAVVFYVKSNDSEILEKIRNPFYYP